MIIIGIFVLIMVFSFRKDEKKIKERLAEINELSSIDMDASRARVTLEKTKDKIALVINSYPEEIIYAPHSYVANSLVIHSTRKFCEENNTKSMLIGSTSHESVINSSKLYKESCGVFYVYPNDYGIITAKSIEEILKQNPSIGFISIPHINRVIKTINPINEIGKICEENGVLFHVDCTNSICREYIDVDEFKCDFLTLSFNRAHSGFGALFVKGVMKDCLIKNINSFKEWSEGFKSIPPIDITASAMFFCEVSKNHITNNRYTNRRKALYFCKNKFFERLNYELSQINLKEDNHNSYEVTSLEDLSASKIFKTINFKINGINSEDLLQKIKINDAVSPNTTLNLKDAFALSEKSQGFLQLCCSNFCREEDINKAATVLTKCMVELKESMN